ncbi:MAG: acetyl-CoA carboxylase biotin carboxyl carrier protein [Bacteriovoracaceae bacterium]|nr:acetyl-CoA carboxylase biotin carboxyl carrier protein [Bacteriovoracaceae bacterium]
MAIDMKGLKDFVKLAKDSGASELVYETKTIKLKVNFGSTSAPVMMHSPVVQTAVAAATPKVSAEAPKAAPINDANIHVVKSPFVGTFYAAPGPGKPAYSKVGDKVKVGQPLCVLEAMKIMNEIDADAAGEIVEICVENESLVEFGQALFKIKRS